LNIKIGGNGRINGLEIIPMSEITSLKIIETSLSPKTFVHLDWEIESTTASYKIYRKKITEDEFIQIGETTDHMFKDNTVELGSSYLYAITLVNEVGVESSTSNEVQADVMNKEISAPSKPNGLKVDGITKDSVTL